MGLTPRLKALKPTIRRLASKGWSAVSIARLYKIPRAEVLAILGAPARPPSPVGPARPICTQTATRVRKLALQGQDAAAIAEALDLCPVKVADFLGRLTPRQAHHRRRGQTLNRPRSAREQAALREWMPNRSADDDDLVVMLAPPPEPPAIAEPIPEPTAWEGGHASPKVGRIDGTPARRGKARPKVRPRLKGDGDGRVKLDAAARAEIRRLFAQGVSKRELARRFGVQPRAIRELLSGHTHAVDGVKPIPSPPPPATPPPATPPPKPSRWREPKGADLRTRGNADQLARDLVMLEVSEPAAVERPADPEPTAWGEKGRGHGY
jgi:hypothetical protein